MLASEIIGLSVTTIVFTVTILISLRYPPKPPRATEQARFLVLMPARNEEAVIGNLIDSIRACEYDQSRIDLLLVSNQSTDRTAEIAAAKGAEIYQCVTKISSKGDALNECYERHLATSDAHDLFCICDSDNLLDPQFFAAMNDMHQAGHDIVQGYRLVKDGGNRWLNMFYQQFYLFVTRCSHRAANALGASTLLSGCGCFISSNLLKRIGGWHTKTLTEDLELSIQSILLGEKVMFCEDAIFYDEAPHSWPQAWSQRKRWTMGSLQSLRLYGARLGKQLFTQFNISCAFALAMIGAGALMVMAVSLAALPTLSAIIRVALGTDVWGSIALALFLWVIQLMIVPALSAMVILVLEGQSIRKSIGGIAAYGVFFINWFFVNMSAIVNPSVSWDEIRHG
ncbi:MAG: glycosyltransferase [Coriobacteriia bacterium]|nr:glycosyltransferase [Coriobacteriia bacterium]